MWKRKLEAKARNILLLPHPWFKFHLFRFLVLFSLLDAPEGEALCNSLKQEQI